MRTIKLICAVLSLALLSSCTFNFDMPDEVETDGTLPLLDAVVTEEEVEEFSPISVDGESAGTLLDYFTELAFGSEYGASADVLCRWEDEILYTVSGDFTDDDTALIAYLADRLNATDGFPGMREASVFEKPNFDVMFITRDEITDTFENATESCVGMAEFSWDTKTKHIVSARVAIDCEETDERESTVCEEVLQALGIAMDSYSHPDSVFYEGRCVYKRPSELDFGVMALLYSPALTAGMTKRDAAVAAAGVLEWEKK